MLNVIKRLPATMLTLEISTVPREEACSSVTTVVRMATRRLRRPGHVCGVCCVQKVSFIENIANVFTVFRGKLTQVSATGTRLPASKKNSPSSAIPKRSF